MEYNEEIARKWEKSHRRGKLAGGFLVVTIGVLFLMRELGAVMPEWLFTWKSLLIAVGFVGFVKHGFARLGWLIPILIGSAFMVADLYPDLSIKPMLWPLLLILVGLVIMFKPRRNYHYWHHRRWQAKQRRYRYMFDRQSQVNSDEDFIDSTSVMGGVKKNILSKKFRGGDITNVFGGTELDLTQADFEGKATLEVTQVFGGTKLIVPANWLIQSNIVTVLGSIEDKRPVNSQTGNDAGKVLVLNGTTFLGGIEIRSF